MTWFGYLLFASYLFSIYKIAGQDNLPNQTRKWIIAGQVLALVGILTVGTGHV